MTVRNSSTKTGPRLTIGILTLNEEKRIASCIKSAKFADQIVVVDSGSKDKTRDIAESLGAEVYEYPDWQGFAVQRNRLLAHASGDYIFFLDADERITAGLQTEIQAAVRNQINGAGEVMWEQVAFGKSLRRMRSTGGVRRMFLKRNIVRFEGLVHEGAILSPPHLPIYTFQHKLIHFSKESVYESLQKMAQYVQLGAAKRALKGKRGGVVRGIASGAGNFIRLYIFGRGFLCGGAGFLYCFMIALECFFRYAALQYDAQSSQTLAKR